LELGVCGTDREILISGQPWTPAGEDRLILGQRMLARIEAIGSGVANFKPGDCGFCCRSVGRAVPGKNVALIYCHSAPSSSAASFASTDLAVAVVG